MANHLKINKSLIFVLFLVLFNTFCYIRGMWFFFCFWNLKKKKQQQKIWVANEIESSYTSQSNWIFWFQSFICFNANGLKKKIKVHCTIKSIKHNIRFPVYDMQLRSFTSFIFGQALFANCSRQPNHSNYFFVFGFFFSWHEIYMHKMFQYLFLIVDFQSIA